MSLEELRQLLAYAGSFGLGGLLAGAIVFLIVKSFIPSYLSEKAKNLATREDIRHITKEIEEVKAHYAAQLQALSHQNAMLVEQFKGQTQLRLAAIDRRLAAHQEAFTLWRNCLQRCIPRKFRTSFLSAKNGGTAIVCI